MNSRGVILKEVVRHLGVRKGSEQAQSAIMSFSETQSKEVSKEEAAKRELKLVRKQQGVKERVFRLYPGLKTSHITKLFGFMSINERAIVNPEHDESFFSSYFHERVIEKVELYDNAILIELASPQPLGSRSLNQMMEIYGNRSESRFHQIGKILNDIFSVASTAKEEVRDEKPQSVKKNLDSLGNSMFVCIFGVRKVAVSKALLAFLSYDFQELALEIIKFKSVNVELFQTNSYFTVLVHILQMFKHICKLSNNEISLSTFKQLTTLRFSDFIVSKDHVRSYCDMTISLISPSCLCHKINFVYYTAEEKWKRGKKVPQLNLMIEEEKDRVRQGEYKLLKKIKEMPDSLFRENEKKTAGYRSLKEENQAQHQI